MADLWTVRRAMDWTRGYLERKGLADARLSAEWLLSAATGSSRIELYTDLERPLSLPERDALRDYVRRRGAGEPLQYISGATAFRHITCKVRRDVLIPRPETEVLVSELFARVPAAECALVADLCTGSGNVACSVAHERPACRVVATDLSPAAVALARENAAALGLDGRVSVVECDLGSGIDEGLLGAFDAVVSNPPYIPTDVLATLPREVADFEPALALDGGADGLDVYRRIVDWACRALRPGGVLAVELHETRLDAAAAVAREAGFSDVRIARDLAGRPRILCATFGRDDG